MKTRIWIATVAALALGALVAGCGSGGSPESVPNEAKTTAVETGAGAATSGEPAEAGGEETGSAEAGGEEASGEEAAVPSEAESLATGDIPDNQAFLPFTNKAAGYSIRYPEGWARTGAGNDVTFREKANVIHIAVHPGKAKSTSGEKTTVTRQSAADPVTGKRLPLLVDVYEFEKSGRVAVLELSTPEGVDNVDAYRLISESFKWL